MKLRIPYWFKMSVRARIFTAFLVMSLLIICVCAVTIWGMVKKNEYFIAYESLNDEATRLTQLDSQAAQIHLTVFKYVYEGRSSSSESVFFLINRLEASIRQFERLPNRSEHVKESLQDILSHLAVYESNFQKVVRERTMYHELVQEKLPVHAEALKERLNALESGQDEKDITLALVYLANMQSFLSLYLQAFQIEQLKVAKRQQELLEQKIRNLETRRGSAELREVQERLKEFRSSKNKAVQSARGYLFLVNVVMSAEMSEVKFKAERLRVAGEEMRLHYQNNFNGLRRGIMTTMVVVSSLAFGVAIFSAYYLSNSVLNPLQQVTATLTALGEGRKDVEIPLLRQQDEIGLLVNSAQVLKKKNEQTEALLEQQKKMTKQLRKNQRQLKLSNEDLEQFAYVASHDLKSPLRAIQNLAHWVCEDCEDLLPEAALSDLNLLQDRVKRMEKLLDGLLAFSRIGRNKDKRKPLGLNKVIDNLVKTLDVPEGFQIKVQNGLPILKATRGALDTIFGNLISNAIKHHDRKRGNIEIQSEIQNGMYHISVRDDGPGIAPEHHKRIFQIFQTLKPKDELESNGMGLSLVKKTVEMHLATVGLESDGSRGSRFIIIWPVT